MFRQGDVLLVPVDALPEGIRETGLDHGRAVLAYGEATGHAHVIADRRAALFRDRVLNMLFLKVGGETPVALEHDEHATILLPPGNYQVIRQREYSPKATRYETRYVQD